MIVLANAMSAVSISMLTAIHRNSSFHWSNDVYHEFQLSLASAKKSTLSHSRTHTRNDFYMQKRNSSDQHAFVRFNHYHVLYVFNSEEKKILLFFASSRSLARLLALPFTYRNDFALKAKIDLEMLFLSSNSFTLLRVGLVSFKFFFSFHSATFFCSTFFYARKKAPCSKELHTLT